MNTGTVLIPIADFDRASVRSDDYIVFGGTFDPPHAGHVDLLRLLLGVFQRVVLAPTHQNPWKAETATPLGLRMEMLSLVLADERLPSAAELGAAGISMYTTPYTYSEEVVSDLRSRLPGRLYWAVGEDSADSVERWRNWGSLRVTTIVCPLRIPVHATDVRTGVAEPHPALRPLIEQHGLYTSPKG